VKPGARSNALLGSLAVTAWVMFGISSTAWADDNPVVHGPVVLPWGQPSAQSVKPVTPVAKTPAAEPDVVTHGDSIGADAVRKATSMLGVPYAWGGGTIAGTSLGVKQGASTDGFDCSGLVTWAYAAAGLDWAMLDPFHIKKFGRLNAQMIFAVSRSVGTNPADFRPGDPLFFGTTRNVHHIGIYLGRQHGRYLMVDAPHTGASVRIERFLNWPDFFGAGRLPGSEESTGTVVSAKDLVLPWGNGGHKPPKPDNHPVPDIVPPPIRQQHVHKPPAATPVVPAGPPSPEATAPTSNKPAKPAHTAVPTVVTPWGSSTDTPIQPADVVPAAPSDIQTAVPVAPVVADSSGSSFSQQVWQDDYDKAQSQDWGSIISDAVAQHLVPLGISQQDGENIDYGILSEETHSTNEYGDGGHGRGPMQVDDRTVPAEVQAQHSNGLDVEWNIHEGTKILAGKIQYFLDQGYPLPAATHFGIAAYNAGQGAVGSVLPGDPDKVTANGHYSAYVLGDQHYLESQDN
jgi:hypothetical protein